MKFFEKVLALQILVTQQLAANQNASAGSPRRFSAKSTPKAHIPQLTPVNELHFDVKTLITTG